MKRLSGIPVMMVAAFACTTDAVEDDGGTVPPNEPECVSDTDCGDPTPLCDVDAAVCQALPAGHQIGWRDGSAASVTLVSVYTPPRPLEATDLAFHPDRPNELWVLHREFESTAPCDQNNNAGCNALEGTTVVISNVGPDQTVQEYKDPNAWHFMRRPPAFAFGDNGNFATVGEQRTGNFLDDPVDYMGPSLWTSALPGVTPGCESSPTGCYTIQPPGGNGSHLDMLHASPWAMGIAHEQANVYWVFNGQVGAIDRYDFAADHGPGNDDHSDGVLRRYVPGQVARVPNVPSHMKYDATDGQLYIADTGNQRVARLDTASGTAGGVVTPNYDSIVTSAIDGAILTDLVPAGRLTAPSGLVIADDVVFVTDNGSSAIFAFDKTTGEELRYLQTGFPAGSLAGMAIGPDNKAYFVDKPTGSVYRIDPM